MGPDSLPETRKKSCDLASSLSKFLAVTRVPAYLWAKVS